MPVVDFELKSQFPFVVKAEPVNGSEFVYMPKGDIQFHVETLSARESAKIGEVIGKAFVKGALPAAQAAIAEQVAIANAQQRPLACKITRSPTAL